MMDCVDQQALGDLFSNVSENRKLSRIAYGDFKTTVLTVIMTHEWSRVIVLYRLHEKKILGL